MENKIMFREYFDSKITMIQDEENDVWFKGCEVASILGYSDKNQAIRMHVDEDDKKKLFRKFQKLSAVPTNGETSTGLGLSIVKTLIEKIEGEIEVKSNLGEGCEFILTIPGFITSD